MEIAVGTTNPVKIEAVRTAIKTIFPDEEHTVIGVDVPSGIADQPMSDAESIKGARNRAQGALEQMPSADLGVGLEGGQQQVGDLWFTGNVACAATREQHLGYGISPKVVTPAEIIAEVQRGKDLTEAVHTVLKIADIGKKEGLIGHMTQGYLTRQTASEQAIIIAVLSALAAR